MDNKKRFFGIQVIMLCLLVIIIVLVQERNTRVFSAIPIFLFLFLEILSCREWMELYKMLLFLKKEDKRKKLAHISNTEEQEQIQLIQKRIAYSNLQSQINPHFLYNTLESIRSRALQDNNEEIANMTELLSKFFRYCISNGEGLIQLREEVNHIQNYYKIQKYRFEQRVEYQMELENTDLLYCYIPKMILQPLIENAMIHGLEQRAEGGKIILKIYENQTELILVIADNGVGMTEEQVKSMNERLERRLYDGNSKKGRHTGIALVNSNARIQLSFGEGYGIHYRSWLGSGTQAVLTLPKITEFERIKYESIFQQNNA